MLGKRVSSETHGFRRVIFQPEAFLVCENTEHSDGGGVDEQSKDKQFLPRFSIKQLMLIMAGFAVISMILGWSIRGSIFAYGIGLSLVGLIAPFAFYAVIFFLSQLFVNFHRRRQPLASAAPNHQVMMASPQPVADSAESPKSPDNDSGQSHTSKIDDADRDAPKSMPSPSVEGDPS